MEPWSGDEAGDGGQSPGAPSLPSQTAIWPFGTAGWRAPASNREVGVPLPLPSKVECSSYGFHGVFPTVSTYL